MWVYTNLILSACQRHILIPVLMMKAWKSQDTIWYALITHPTKSVVVFCVYYKSFLPLIVSGVHLLEECIIFDLIISNKLCSFVALYRSPSQSQDDFATFSDNFEMTLDLVSKKNPFLIVVLGDFNAKLSQWHDKDSSTSEGISIENITSQFGLHQIINEPTHILENSS